MSVNGKEPAGRTRVAIVGAGLGGLAAALEAVDSGVDPDSIAVIEARPASARQRNIVVDRFMIERLTRFGALPPSLNPWNALAVTIGGAAFGTPIMVPTVGQMRSDRIEAPPSVHLLGRIPAGVAHLADVNQTLRRVAVERGIRVLMATRVVDILAGPGGRVLRLETETGPADLSAETVVLACGAGSPLLAHLGVRREWVEIPHQPWMIAFFDGMASYSAAMRVLDREADGADTCYYISSKTMTSMTLGLRLGAAPDRDELATLARRAADHLGIPGPFLDAFVFDTQTDRATAATLGPDCVLLGDALRRSDVTYGGGANAAFVDAWWLGRYLRGEIGVDRYAAAVAQNTDELIRGSWAMRMFDGLLAAGQSGRRMWPAPARRAGDVAVSLMTQSVVAAATAWARLLTPRRPE